MASMPAAWTNPGGSSRVRRSTPGTSTPTVCGAVCTKRAKTARSNGGAPQTARVASPLLPEGAVWHPAEFRSVRNNLSEARWLWVVSRIGIVFEHFLDDGTSDKRLQFGLQRISFILLVNFLAPNIERKGLGVFCLLCRVVNGLLRPFIKRIILGPVGLGLADITCEGIELAFQDSIVPVQYIYQRRHCRIVRIVPCH